jgi:hypothetical protein
MAARLLVICLLLCALLAAPAAGQVTTTPLGPVPQDEPEDVPDPTADEDDGLSNTQLLLLGGAAFVLLAGIGWAILRDARAVAPVDTKSHAHSDSSDRPKGTRTPPKQRVQSGRAKAKAARRARKRNMRKR